MKGFYRNGRGGVVSNELYVISKNTNDAVQLPSQSLQLWKN
ncbi:hypothetical protein ACI6Q2_04520 [Chitinophagaceae bacterium LWZ2-11]